MLQGLVNCSKANMGDAKDHSHMGGGQPAVLQAGLSQGEDTCQLCGLPQQAEELCLMGGLCPF